MMEGYNMELVIGKDAINHFLYLAPDGELRWYNLIRKEFSGYFPLSSVTYDTFRDWVKNGFVLDDWVANV